MLANLVSPRGWLRIRPALILTLWGAQSRQGRRSSGSVACFRWRLPNKPARPEGQHPPITQAAVLYEFMYEGGVGFRVSLHLLFGELLWLPKSRQLR